MSKPILVASLAVLGTALLMLASAFWWREPLATAVANHFLAAHQIKLTGLHGLHPGITHIAVDELTLMLPSGQQLTVTTVDATIGFAATSAPSVESLRIGAVQLHAASAAAGTGGTEAASTLLLSDVLQLLREFPLATLEINGLGLPQSQASLVLELQHSDGELNVHLYNDALELLGDFTQATAAATAEIHVTLARNHVAIGNVTLSLQPAGPAYTLAGSGHLALADLDSMFGAVTQQASQQPLKTISVDWKLDGTIADDLRGALAGTVPTAFRLQTTGLAVTGLPPEVPAFDIDARLMLDHRQLSFTTALLLRKKPSDAAVVAKGSYDLATDTASMQVSVPPVTFKEKSQQLSSWFDRWPYAFDLLTGSLAAELELQWQPAAGKAEANVLTANLSVTLKDVAGYYDDIFFRGMNTALRAHGETAPAFSLETPALALTIASVDVGVPVNNVAVNFHLDRDTQRLIIASFAAETLGGKLASKDIAYDFSKDRNDIKLHFSGLQLERMLESTKYDGVQASGTITGDLPLTLTANGIEVTKGTLLADAPGGHIRYLAGAKAGVTGNAGVDLMNQALGNYQYEALASSIDYNHDGELVLAVHLQGENPDLNKGQRINLNLTLSDNIPALLKSLRAARVIEDFLQKKY